MYVQCRLRGPGIQTLERGGHILNQSSKGRSLVSKLHLSLSSFVAKRNFTTEVCIPGPLRLDGDYIPPLVELYRFILYKLALFARPISHMSISCSIYSGGSRDFLFFAQYNFYLDFILFSRFVGLRSTHFVS